MRPVATFVAAASLCAATSAGAEPLAVKLGLWRMTTTLHMPGPIVSPDIIAGLPPEARAPMQAALSGLSQPHISRTCLTAEKLRRGFQFDEHHPKDCQQQILAQTATTLDMRGTCQTGDGTADMHATFHTVNPETLAGHFDVTRRAAEGPNAASGDITGTWLGESCAGADNEDAPGTD